MKQPPHNQWISVNDSLPPTGVLVLYYDEDGIFTGWRSERDWWVRPGDMSDFCAGTVTHWMPLPKTPE